MFSVATNRLRAVTSLLAPRVSRFQAEVTGSRHTHVGAKAAVTTRRQSRVQQNELHTTIPQPDNQVLAESSMFSSVIREFEWIAVSLRGKLSVLAVAGACVALGFTAPRQAAAQITLSAGTLPAAAQPGIQSVRATGNKFPAGTISAGSITVSLAPVTAGAGRRHLLLDSRASLARLRT